MDETNATVTLENSTIVKGDLLLGADRVHSVTKRKVTASGKDVKPYGSGKSAFRFMISRKTAQADPVTSKFVQKPGELIIWYGADRRVVLPPTTNNTLLNFTRIHPDFESEAGEGNWNTGGHQVLKSLE